VKALVGVYGVYDMYAMWCSLQVQDGRNADNKVEKCIGAPPMANRQKLSPSCSHKFPNVASQIRVAFLRIVSNTRSSSPDELEITPSTSVAAANCTIASSRSRVKRAAFVSSPAAEESRRGAARALRRFGVAALRLGALVGLLFALERRRIAHPRLRTTPIFKEVLQQGFAIGGMGFRGQVARQQS
jgi:hypothetical protein